MKAVIFGPGRIGCGFAGQVLCDSGYDVVFLARNPAMVTHLNRMRGYRVSLSNGHRTVERFIDVAGAIGTFEPRRAIAELAAADLIVTAVGAGNLPDVAELLAAGLRARRAPVNVLAFENLPQASRRLRELVLGRANAREGGIAHGLAGTLVDRVVAARIGAPVDERPMQFVGDDATELRVDATQLVPPLPVIQGMIATDAFDAWVKRKLYTYSAGHATTAYLGSLKGYHYIHSAIRDREIRAAVLAAMAEGQRGLVARYGPEIGGTRHDLLAILARFENASLGDRIERVGRDPQRKLALNERLLGAAHLAQRAGVPPLNLALAAAAALCFVVEEDGSSTELERLMEQDGQARTIQRVCGLRSDQGLGRLVGEDCERLRQGRSAGGLLLHLGSDLWSVAVGQDAPAEPESASPATEAARGPSANGAVAETNGHARPSVRHRQAGRLKLHFIVVRRVPPVPSPVLEEVYRILERRGFRVDAGIPEEVVQRADEVRVEHDLYVVKSHTELALSLAGTLHHLGARVLHDWPSAMAVQNKIVTSRLLRGAGVPAPDSWVTGDLTLLHELLEQRPLILKPYLGHRGQGLRILRDPRDLPGLPPLATPMLAQEYVPGAGEDLKVYVVGDEVFAVRKPFSQGSFTQSGRPCPVEPEVRDIALRCGRALGLGLYGLDIVESNGQAWVVDVNTFPGYKGVPDVAPRIADYIEGYATGRIAPEAPVPGAPVQGAPVQSTGPGPGPGPLVPANGAPVPGMGPCVPADEHAPVRLIAGAPD
jgi:mannitol-1-phosphate/altronate dehydrogenase/glutathione synthase/RimK-type ligase-like ATP-grasp enzyme